MEHMKIQKVKFTEINDKGEFNCPKCKIVISPDDKTEKSYSIIEPIMIKDQLEKIVLECKKCRNLIHLELK